MNEVARAIIKSGVLDEDTVAEFKRWGVPVEGLEVRPRPASLNEVSKAVVDALESEDLVVTKVTDLEVIHQYLRSQKTGKLRLVLDEDGSSTEFEVSYGRTAMGEYILPWTTETLGPEMTNGQTRLKTADSKSVYFSDVQEIYFGDQKAFMLCTPAKENDGHEG